MPMLLLSMNFVSKKSGQLNVSISDDVASTLETIHEKHGVPAPELVRQLLDGVVKFYNHNGYFTLPVHIIPDVEFLRMVRETTPFGVGALPTGLKEGPAHPKTPTKKKSA